MTYYDDDNEPISARDKAIELGEAFDDDRGHRQAASSRRVIRYEGGWHSLDGGYTFRWEPGGDQ